MWRAPAGRTSPSVSISAGRRAVGTNGFADRLDDFIQRISDQNDDQKARLNKTNTSLDDQIAAIERRLEQQRAIMESAFIQMERAQAKIQQQQSAMNSMFAQPAGA